MQAAGDIRVEYEVKRTKRRTLAITVDKNSGSVIVRAPLNMPSERIDSFVKSKNQWLEKQCGDAAVRTNARRKRLGEYPSELPFLGEMCPVDHCQPYGYSDGCFHLPENVSLEKLIPFLRRLYVGIARETLTARTQLIADRMKVEIAAVKVNSAKTRWGSCTSNGVINLSYKLIAANPPLIDYVIVHELCHISHMDHSTEFWEDVEAVIPDYRARREALKEVQKSLCEFGLD